MKKVVVFAGHDHDTWDKLGAKGIKTDLEKDGAYEEFDTNFIIAKGTVERLRKVKGLTVLFPQENGRKMSLKERVDYANEVDADLLVDIHSNASASRTATGAAAFYWKGSEDGKRIADYYASLLKQQGLPTWQGGTYPSNPGTWSEFYMLKHSNMPGILTENFFFTTRSELENYLLNPAVQKKLINIHAEMVTQYFGFAYEAGKTTVKEVVQVSKDYWMNGDDGKPIEVIQDNLNFVGYTPKLTVDGIFGDGTEEGVKWFQKKHGLAVDGVAGKATISKLNSKVAEIEKAATDKKVADDAKKAAAAKPKAPLYRFKIDGDQKEALSDLDNILAAVKKAVEAGENEIMLKKKVN